jgi:hypothetical protein
MLDVKSHPDLSVYLFSLPCMPMSKLESENGDFFVTHISGDTAPLRIITTSKVHESLKLEYSLMYILGEAEKKCAISESYTLQQLYSMDSNNIFLGIGSF